MNQAMTWQWVFLCVCVSCCKNKETSRRRSSFIFHESICSLMWVMIGDRIWMELGYQGWTFYLSANCLLLLEADSEGVLWPIGWSDLTLLNEESSKLLQARRQGNCLLKGGRHLPPPWVPCAWHSVVPYQPSGFQGSPEPALAPR